MHHIPSLPPEKLEIRYFGDAWFQTKDITINMGASASKQGGRKLAKSVLKAQRNH